MKLLLLLTVLAIGSPLLLITMGVQAQETNTTTTAATTTAATTTAATTTAATTTKATTVATTTKATTVATTTKATTVATTTKATTVATTTPATTTKATTAATTTEATTAATTTPATTTKATTAATTTPATTTEATTVTTTTKATTAATTTKATTAATTTKETTTATTAASTSKATGTTSTSKVETTTGAHTSSIAPTSTHTSAPTSLPTTVTTVTAAPTQPPIGKQNFSCEYNDTTKFNLTGSFSLSITYTLKDGKTNKTLVIAVPKTSDIETNCTSYEGLTFRFFDGWSIEYIFGQAPAAKQLSATEAKYYVSNITVTYVHGSHLPDSNTPNATSHARYESSNYLESSGGVHYSCSSKTNLNVNNDVVLTTTDFKYKAFNDKGDINLDTGSANQCAADAESTSSIVPIAVGAALAGLVVIVLIAYLIGRKRSRKTGYETV